MVKVEAQIESWAEGIGIYVVWKNILTLQNFAIWIHPMVR